MTLPPEPLDKDALITTLLERNASQAAEIERLVSVITELEAKLKRPRKGPGNSSVPPSQGQKASGSQAPKTKSEPHAGAHRPLHPNPTSKRDVFAQQCACGADLSGVAQESRQAYDHVQIPSPWAAALYADTRSVIETGRRRSVRAIEAIRLTLAQTPIPTTA